MAAMSANAFALVITAALLHSIWNIAAKRAGGDDRFTLIACVQLLVLWAPVGLWFGWGVLPGWRGREWGVVLGNAVLHLVYFQTLLRGYRLSDLTVVYPIARGTGPLLSSLGVFFIAGGPALWAKAHEPSQRARVRAWLAYGAATGALIAGYTLVDGYAVKVMLLAPVLIDYIRNLFRLPFLLPAALRDRRAFVQAWHAQWRYALVVAVFGPLGYVLLLYAVRLAPLSHVTPAREVSMLFAALVGGRLLSEGDRGSRVAGARCIGCGVAALALG